jgi:hypothetical protein
VALLIIEFLSAWSSLTSATEWNDWEDTAGALFVAAAVKVNAVNQM